MTAKNVDGEAKAAICKLRLIHTFTQQSCLYYGRKVKWVNPIVRAILAYSPQHAVCMKVENCLTFMQTPIENNIFIFRSEVARMVVRCTMYLYFPGSIYSVYFPGTMN